MRPSVAAASFLLALVVLSTASASQDSETLGSVKRKYLNQKIVIVSDDMMTWVFAKEESGRYQQTDWADFLPSSYKGNEAVVIAVQLKDGRPKVNAMGESIGVDSTVNPYFDVVVRFRDGKMAMTSSYPSTLSQEIKLWSVQSGVAEEMSVKLPSIVGTNFYATGVTRLYQTDSTLQELLNLSLFKRIPRSDIPYLVSLQVTGARYDKTANAVILKLKLPNGKEALSIATGENDQFVDQEKPFLERISGFLMSSVPPGLTAQEVSAIKRHNIFRGMKVDAVYWAFGLPEQENDWGRGGKQLVYSEEHVFVYVNNQRRVTDWQSLGR